MDLERALAQKKRRLAQLLAIAPHTDKQLEEIERLAQETGEPVYWQVFHFGLGYKSPAFTSRQNLLEWVALADAQVLGAAKRRQVKPETAPKRQPKPKKNSERTLEGKPESINFGLFATADTHLPDSA